MYVTCYFFLGRKLAMALERFCLVILMSTGIITTLARQKVFPRGMSHIHCPEVSMRVSLFRSLCRRVSLFRYLSKRVSHHGSLSKPGVHVWLSISACGRSCLGLSDLQVGVPVQVTLCKRVSLFKSVPVQAGVSVQVSQNCDKNVTKTKRREQQLDFKTSAFILRDVVFAPLYDFAS